MLLATRGLCILCAIALAPCVREPARRTATATRGETTAGTAAPDAPQPTARGGGGGGDGASAVTARTDASRGDGAALAQDIPVPEGLAPVIDSVRREAWREARSRLAGLSPAVQQTREARYVGGRIAIALGDEATAVTLLHELGPQIPALAVDIARLEAGALARAGRHAEARVAYERLAAQTGADKDRALAAIEALAQGDHAAAVGTMRAWAQSPPAGVDRTRAWRSAAQALEAAGDPTGAARAWKRVMVDEPDTRAATDAAAALARLNAPLTVDESLARAATLNARARYAETIAELNALPAAQGAAEARRLHLLGRALYWSRSRYAEAHATLTAAAQRADNPDRDEDAFLAARSLARADQDDTAIVAFDRVARTRSGRWSDEAAFRAAWLEVNRDRVEPAITRLRAFLRDRPDATEQLRSEVAWQLGWMLLTARRYADAATALEQSSELASRALERGRGRYWAAVARLRAGDADAAVREFQAIIAERPLTYYALLGEARLRQRGVTVPPPRDPAPRREAPPLPLPENVRWLRALGFVREGGAVLAAQESALRAQLPRERADEILALGYLELGEPHRAYAIAQRHGDDLDHEPTADNRWVWDCAYPRPYPHWIEAAEDRAGLPRHYLYAIMRQESAYNERDVSNARAIGLLQMIPPTTRRVAQELRIEWREELLFEPEYNIRTGGHYIGRLFAQYRGVLPRAIGAFNGGPGAMGRWVRRWPDLELDAFVERIPFDETRTYVRRVEQNLARYRYLYGPRGDDWPLRLALSAEPTVEQVVDY